MSQIRIADAWGRIILDPEYLFELAYEGNDVFGMLVRDGPIKTNFNETCRMFGKDNFCFPEIVTPKETPEETHRIRASRWTLGQDLAGVDLREFLLSLCDEDRQRARVNEEMDLFEERQLIPVLRCMIDLVNRFRQHNVVWGVGRGSSVSSYVLFLIGIHKIDSLKYNLDIRDFLKA